MRVFGVSFLLLGISVSACAGNSGESNEVQVGQQVAEPSLAYEQVDITAGPEGYDYWGPFGVSNRGDVLGFGQSCDLETGICSFDLLELDRELEFSVVAEGFLPGEVTDGGDVGGCVIIDDVTLFGQAAIVRSSGAIELVPPLPGEISSCIFQLSDNGTAVVSSFDADFVETRYVLSHGRIHPLELPDAVINDVNNRGELAGIVPTPDGERAFRFDARRQIMEILEPLPTEPHSWGLAINQRGDVLGYSFVFGGVERIGKWNGRNEFSTYFVEGTPESPTISNLLTWNESGLVIVSYTSDGNTYLIPKAGVRLNLRDLVGGASVPSTLVVFDVNDRGAFVATSLADGSTQLYRRTNR